MEACLTISELYGNQHGTISVPYVRRTLKFLILNHNQDFLPVLPATVAPNKIFKFFSQI